MAEQILAHPVARHVAALSGLDIDALSQADESSLVSDVGRLLVAARHPAGLIDENAVLKHVAAIRQHMADAERAAPALGKLWARMQPPIDAAEALARRYQQAFPRHGGRLYVAEAVADCFVEIYARRRGEPMTGTAATSDCHYRLQGVVDCLKVQTRNGTVTDIANKSIRKFKAKKR